MLFDTIEKVCLKYNSTEQSYEIQKILSNIFNIICKAGSIRVVIIHMAIIDLVSKLLLSDKIKGIYNLFVIYYKYGVINLM